MSSHDGAALVEMEEGARVLFCTTSKRSFRSTKYTNLGVILPRKCFSEMIPWSILYFNYSIWALFQLKEKSWRALEKHCIANEFVMCYQATGK